VLVGPHPLNLHCCQSRWLPPSSSQGVGTVSHVSEKVHHHENLKQKRQIYCLNYLIVTLDVGISVLGSVVWTVTDFV
jgi:hypothetical protein